MSKRKVYEVTEDNNMGKDEAWCYWYSCPKSECTNISLRHGDNFCAECGCRLDWSKTND